jgi:hypothetical protein
MRNGSGKSERAGFRATPNERARRDGAGGEERGCGQKPALALYARGVVMPVLLLTIISLASFEQRA